MRLKCGACGKDIDVQEELADGQHVHCPFCGEVTSYRKPTRIELPTGAGALRRAALAGGQKVESTVEASSVDNVENDANGEVLADRKLRVIRKPNPVAEDYNPDGQRKIRIAEEHARFFEELRTMEARRKVLHNIGSIAALLLVVVVGVSAILVFNWRRAQTERMRVEAARQEESLRVQREQHDAELKKQRAAAEKARREEERQRLTRERAAADAANKAEKEKKQTEQKMKEEKLRQYKELYCHAMASFENGRFDFLTEKSASEFLKVREGAFYYLLPYSEDGQCTVSVLVVSNGVSSVFRLDRNGNDLQEDVERFNRKLKDRDYLVSNGDQTFFHSTRTKPHVGKIPKGNDVDLAEELFGSLAPEVKSLRCDFDDLYFEIVFIPQGANKQVIITQEIDYGLGYSKEKIREAVEEAFPFKAKLKLGGRNKLKKFKRTVKYWEGAQIKRGIDGVTYVPRTAPIGAYYGSGSYNRVTLVGGGWDWGRSARNEYKYRARSEQLRDQWQKLCELADQQDQAEREYNDRLAAERNERVSNALNDENVKYAQRIDDILEEGTLFWRARLKWKKGRGN